MLCSEVIKGERATAIVYVSVCNDSALKALTRSRSPCALVIESQTARRAISKPLTIIIITITVLLLKKMITSPFRNISIPSAFKILLKIYDVLLKGYLISLLVLITPDASSTENGRLDACSMLYDNESVPPLSASKARIYRSINKDEVGSK